MSNKIGNFEIIKKHFGTLEITKEVLNGSVIYESAPPTPTYPVKSDIILLNLDGNGNKRYRVLKNVSGTTYLVVSLYSLTSVAFNSSNQTYFNGALDTYLNTTWYNTLSTTAKNAIVSKYITQYSHSRLSSMTSNRVSWASTTKTTVASNSRKIYALSVSDIDEYFNFIYSNSDLTNTFNLSMSLYNVWTRDKNSSDSRTVWVITYGSQTISAGDHWNNGNVTAAFQIDLSKIEFTIEV